MVGFTENGLKTRMKPSDVVETRRIPAHIQNLYPETLQIKDLRAIDRKSMFTFGTFTTADHLDVQFGKLSSATQLSRLEFVLRYFKLHQGQLHSEGCLERPTALLPALVSPLPATACTSAADHCSCT